MVEKTGLLNQRVMMVLRRFHPQTPREIIRGIITEVDEFGVRLSGRRFREVTDHDGHVGVERPVEAETKVYWVPFNSIRYSEIILPGSVSERADTEIQSRKLITPQELRQMSV
jgi:hypothetical protein